MTDDVDPDLDDDFLDPDPDPEPEPEPAPAPDPEPAPAPAPAAEPAADPNAELLLAALGTLKTSWTNDAKAAGYVTADFDGIDMKGIDDAAKAAFLDEAKASHDQKVKALEAQGFVFNPAAAQEGSEAAAQAAAEEQARQQWGPAGPGQVATGGEKFDQQIADEVQSGDAMGVLRTLVGKGKLAEFALRKRG